MFLGRRFEGSKWCVCASAGLPTFLMQAVFTFFPQFTIPDYDVKISVHYHFIF